MVKIERAICYVLAFSTEALVEELEARKKEENFFPKKKIIS